MFNLLPETEKKHILKEYSMRRLVVLLFFLLVSGLIALICIFPSKLLSQTKEENIRARIETTKKSPILAESELLISTLSAANLKLAALSPPPNEILIEDLFDRVIARKSTNIKLRNLVYKRSANKDSSTIQLTGVALNRESLSTFVEDLKKEPLFKEVNLPVSDLTKGVNATFSIQLKGTF
jgi:cell division protein FtsL